MIEIPYYNPGKVDFLPSGYVGEQQSNNQIYFNSGVTFAFEQKEQVFVSFYYRSNYFWDSCGFKFLLGNGKYLRFSANGNLSGVVSKTVARDYTGLMRVDATFTKDTDGLHMKVECPLFAVEEVVADGYFEALSLYSYSYLGEILVSTTKTKALSFQTISVDSIDPWQTNASNEYVLTDTKETGVVHLNQETVDKLLADNDVVGCILVANTNKKGSKLKSLELKINDEVATKEVPVGKGAISIPMFFQNPSDLKNITLSVKGE